MSKAKITLIGMYNYYSSMGGDLFEFLTLPDGVSKDITVNTILMDGGEYEVIYSDPDFVRQSIAIWSAKWQRTIERWFNALDLEYNPLYNYDRTEEQIRTPNLTDQRTADLTNQRTDNLTSQETKNLTDERTPDLTSEKTLNLEDEKTLDLEDERTPDVTEQRTLNTKDKRTPDLETERTPDLTDTNGGTATEEHQVSAFDSSTYQPESKIITTPANTLKHTGTETVTETGTDTTDHTGTDTLKTTGTDTTTHTGTDTTTHTGTDTTTETGTETTTHTGTDTTTNTGTQTQKETGTDTNTHTGTEKWNIRAYGNIGVVTSQQMLESELLVARFSLYNEIAKLFLTEYVIPVM